MTPVEFQRRSWLALRWIARERYATEPLPTDVLFREFARAAAAAAVFELKMHLMADAVPEIRRYAGDDLGDLERRVTAHLRAHGYAAEELEILPKAARIRNRLLHAELSKVTGHLSSLGIALAREHVTMVDLTTGATRSVARTKTEDGRVFGWLLESAASGAFVAARKLFHAACKLIDWELHRIAGETTD